MVPTHTGHISQQDTHITASKTEQGEWDDVNKFFVYHTSRELCASPGKSSLLYFHLYICTLILPTFVTMNSRCGAASKKQVRSQI
jgi:hypothetical protein